MPGRGTTFMGDHKFPEFWPCSIAHDLHYEGKLFGGDFDREFAKECREVVKGLNAGDSLKFQRGVWAYLSHSGMEPYSRAEADKAFNRHMKRVIRNSRHLRGRARQLKMARAQRMFFINMPAPLKRAFLWVNRLLGRN